jgi:pantoate--beta-alanine ligase
VELTPSAATFQKMLDAARAADLSVGLVPTMGSLHAGHLSLIEAAREQCEVVAVSIFVNPLQFGPSEDFAAYPRDLEGDAGKASAAGADCVFAPDAAGMFPGGPPATRVRVDGLGSILEGAARPTHFEGVCTVVAKLLSLAGPCRAFFGEKDYQQLTIIRRLVSDLSIAAEIVACPIVREQDGLALSSRNVRLTPDERVAAPALYRALLAGAQVLSDAGGAREATGGAREATGGAVPGQAIDGGALTAAAAEAEGAMANVLAEEPLLSVDYAVVRDAATLAPVTEPESGADGASVLASDRRDLRLLVTARLGTVRLIDNLGVAVEAPAATS